MEEDRDALAPREIGTFVRERSSSSETPSFNAVAGIFARLTIYPLQVRALSTCDERHPAMLHTLSIKNLALLEEVSLEFDAGFTVVTGETGAGKSVLLGGLSLLAGQRADKTIIRQGAAACEVEASLHFAKPERINAVLSELELPPCEEGQLILRRILPRDKPQKITINGSMATLAALQQLGESWIDFHGPSEPRRLLKDSCQLELLDLFAQNTKEREQYALHYKAWQEARSERQRLTSETRLAPDQIAYLEAQISKLESLELTEQAIAELERDHTRATQAQDLIGLASGLSEALIGEDSLTGRLSAILREARNLEAIDPSSRSLAERLASTVIELSDLGESYQALAADCQFDPEQAALLEERMTAWLDAKRRHGSDVEAVAAALEEMRQKLALQGDIEGALHRQDQLIAKLEKQLALNASALRATREKAARELAKTAAKAIAQLGFKKAEFLIRIEGLESFTSSGDCRCEFVFSPNVGEAPLPLSRIASSGELARVMLALKTVLADLDSVPVLVFDEVDANVGGEIGRVVGRELAGIANGHQVFCITHLPQVAALGRSHYLVEKDQSSDRARVSITALHQERDTRIAEIARMLGDRNAPSARTHASELLASS